MLPPIQITFHNVQPSPAATTRIRAAATKLERYYKRITSCHVVVEAAQRHQRHGNPYHVHIELHLPGAKLMVRRQPGRRPTSVGNGAVKTVKQLQPDTRHKDMYVAIHDAFDVARRRLEDYAQKQRGEVKVAAPRRSQTPNGSLAV
jgi:ribosome-associated translation inhibitor RaiA